MTESKTDTDNEALKAWFKPLLDAVVLDLQARNVVAGTAVEASPVWMFPYKILISKVWGLGQKNRFIWTIAGEAVVTDHIPGNMAATPKDAARHFSLKWQMDADRLIALGNTKRTVAGTQQHMGDYANKLIRNAEALYDLTEHDEIWQ
jgi:hypothetical protein